MHTHNKTIDRLRQRTDLAQAFADDAEKLVYSLEAQARLMADALCRLRASEGPPGELESHTARANALAAHMTRAAAALGRTHAAARQDLREAEDIEPLAPELATALRAAIAALGDACHAVSRAAETLEKSLAPHHNPAHRFWMDAAGALPH